jgi:hypothetical protein
MFSVTEDRLTEPDADALAVLDEDDGGEDEDEQPATARPASASVMTA